MGRAQAFTLEAVVGAIILLATMTFALQAVGISSNTASAGDTEIRNQHAGLGEGVLDVAVQNGSLKRTLLYWSTTQEAFHGAEAGYYVSRRPPTEFGNSVVPMFDDRQVRYNVDLYYRSVNNTRERQRLVESGTPGDTAVRVVETVTLYDDDRPIDADGNYRNVTLKDVYERDTGEFYAPDAGEDSHVYNVVRVEVILWQS